MKAVLIGISLLATSAVYAQGLSYFFENVSEEFCPNKEIDYDNDSVTCDASDSGMVSAAKVGKELTYSESQGLGFYTFGAVDAGMVPDDGSHTAYYYKRWLVDSSGRKVGVLTIEGWTNSDLEDAAKFKVRYNLKGEVVQASASYMGE